MMEPTELKKNQMSGQGVQQLHLSLIKSQPDTDKSLILLENENTMEKSTTEKPKQAVLEVDSDHNNANAIHDDLSIERPIGQPRQYDPTIDDRLPDTVTLLTTPEGAKVYLIGTAHFSKESQDDVSLIIQAVQPHIVMIELCKARVHVLQLDEKTILEEAKNLNLHKIRLLIKQNGFFNGLIYILLLNMSANVTKQLGMAPGGEFRRAFLEAKRIPNCLVHLGDRPINITLHRALHSLTWWQTIVLFWKLLRTKDPITKEDVERCKHRDLLEKLLADMTAKFPSLGETFVNERDLFLTHSLQLAASRLFQTSDGIMPARVVGIVGIGHTPGMIRNWGKVKSSDIAPLMNIPPQSLSVKILRITFRASLIGAIVYAGYKLLPLPSGATFQSLKSSVEGLVKVSVNR
ncbi:traB domain-containing protein isoform X2 [Chelonus insularis]|uniref:traB domain-containing protein isoform X2 n=1 Tax=Chelonus insularis TaxID=460826 RepID=UPI00158AFBEC|nr:traB domain-containing protein isoform X2 [Chelonus insularis]